VTLPRPFTAERKRVCVSAPLVPHGVGHNSVCICLCRWCVEERAPSAPMQADLFPALPRAA
jgi:hypothetical protein